MRGFWLAWAGRGSRAGAGFCWVPEWQVLLGEGFLVGRVLGEGFLVGRGSSSWKGFLHHIGTEEGTGVGKNTKNFVVK